MNFKLLNWYASLPAAVMIMIGIFLVGLILARMKVLSALKSSIFVAAGIVGMGTMTGMFAGAVAPILSQIVEKTDMGLSVIDMGVGTQANVIFSLDFYAILLPIGLAVNVIMLLLKFTNTFDVDIFNYVVWALTSSFVYVTTGSKTLAIIGFIITEIVVLKLADITAPALQKAYGLEGISIPHGNAIIFAPVGMAVNWMIEKIPGVRDINWSPESIDKRFGGIVQPSTIGFVLGTILGIVSGSSFGSCVMLGVTIAGFMIIFPKILSVLVEGIQPVADGMRKNAEKWLKRELLIGLDAAILIGMPDVAAVGIMLVPVILLLAFILPGNRVLPLADLAVAGPFLVSCIMPYCKKNIFRGFISGIFLFTIVLYVTSATADWYTAAAALNGEPLGAVGTSLGIASSWLSWFIASIFKFFA